MAAVRHFLIEGIDRLGKDSLARGIQERLGYHLVIHYSKPLELDTYRGKAESPARAYQEASFRAMFHVLRAATEAPLICNRAHLGEYVYAPMYRGYAGDYVFEIEQSESADTLTWTRLVLLVEDFDTSEHFEDDGRSLGGPEQRRAEQERFKEAFGKSILGDKRMVCVTDPETGQFRLRDEILAEALA